MDILVLFSLWLKCLSHPSKGFRSLLQMSMRIHVMFSSRVWPSRTTLNQHESTNNLARRGHNLWNSKPNHLTHGTDGLVFSSNGYTSPQKKHFGRILLCAPTFGLPSHDVNSTVWIWQLPSLRFRSVDPFFFETNLIFFGNAHSHKPKKQNIGILHDPRINKKHNIACKTNAKHTHTHTKRIPSKSQISPCDFHTPGDSRWPFDPLVGGHQQP